ncbi:MAG: hypothetical protein VW447_06700, partial [Limnobacter sp.]
MNMQVELHNAEFNKAREAKGLKPLNALWFWGGGEGQFSSKIMSKSNEELTLMMKDTDKWDGFWTNNPEGAPESTMGTTTPRTIETGLTPREGEESDFPTSGE